MERGDFGEEQRPRWYGTSMFFFPDNSSYNTNFSNVPGVAIYMTSLTQLRSVMASSHYFTVPATQDRSNTAHDSVLPKLTNTGNLVAGASTRVGVGFLMNPLTLLKARFEATSSLFALIQHLLMQSSSEQYLCISDAFWGVRFYSTVRPCWIASRCICCFTAGCSLCRDFCRVLRKFQAQRLWVPYRQNEPVLNCL